MCSGEDCSDFYCSFHLFVFKGFAIPMQKSKKYSSLGEKKSSFYHYNLLYVMKYFIKHNRETD